MGIGGGSGAIQISELIGPSAIARLAGDGRSWTYETGVYSLDLLVPGYGDEPGSLTIADAAPEPGGSALMIVGVGLVGAGLRRIARGGGGRACGLSRHLQSGGPGHGWVKARHVDPGPHVVVAENGLHRIFIPARLADNPALLGLPAKPAPPSPPDRWGRPEPAHAWKTG